MQRSDAFAPTGSETLSSFAMFKELITALEDRGYPTFGNGDSRQTYCPFCEGDGSSSPSLSLSEREDGHLLFYCFSDKSPEGCNIGRTSADLAHALLAAPVPHAAARRWRDARGTHPRERGGELVRTYEYPAGAIKERWQVDGRKEFRWPRGKPAGPLLYRDSVPGRVNWLTEGERDCETLEALGLAATTVSEGYLSPSLAARFAGLQVCVLWDADRHGIRKRDNDVELLRDASAHVTLIDLGYEVQERGGMDVSDWLETHTVEELKQLARAQMGLHEATDVDLPESEPDPIVPFPVDVFPPSLRDAVSTFGSRLNVPVDLVAAPALAYASAAVGTSRRLAIPGAFGPEPPAVYIASVCPPGSGKTEPGNLLAGPFTAKQQEFSEEYQSDFADYKRDIQFYVAEKKAWTSEAVKTKKAGGSASDAGPPPEEPEPPVLRKAVVTDFTMEALGRDLGANRRGIMIRIDELSGLLTSMNMYRGGAGNDRQRWLSMWTCEPLIVSRISRDMLNLERPFVAVFGTIQPDMLGNISDEQGRQDGFIHRWLFVYPETPRMAFPSGGSYAAEAVWDKIVNRLYSLEPDEHHEPITVGMTEGAMAVWREFYGANAEEVNRLSDVSRFRGPWVKISRYWSRLALLLHLLRWAADDGPDDLNPLYVDADSARGATALVTYFKGQTRKVYKRLAAGPLDDTAHRVLRVVQKSGVATARDVARTVNRIKTAEEAQTYLDDLVAAGWLHAEEHRPGPQGGRPTTVYVPVERA